MEPMGSLVPTGGWRRVGSMQWWMCGRWRLPPAGGLCRRAGWGGQAAAASGGQQHHLATSVIGASS